MWIVASFQSISLPFIQILPVTGNAISAPFQNSIARVLFHNSIARVLCHADRKCTQRHGEIPLPALSDAEEKSIEAAGFHRGGSASGRAETCRCAVEVARAVTVDLRGLDSASVVSFL